MRTSVTQFEVMLEFMERNGDLNKPPGGPQARLNNYKKWKELASALNIDPSGATKPVDKWKKVWSDLKNNTKKKGAKINRAASGGGPPSKLELTDLEKRVLNLVGQERRRNRCPYSPLQTEPRRDSAQSQRPDAASEQFVSSDMEWQNLAKEFVAENTRLRERELRQQDRWQTLFARFLDIMEQFVPSE